MAFSLDRNDELDMRGKNEDDLMMLCALSGCDYLPSVHGVGLKKAHRLVSRHKEVRTLPYHVPWYTYDTVPYRTIAYILPYLTAKYHTVSHLTVPCHTKHYHVIPYHTTSYHNMPHRTVPYHAVPYHTIPWRSLSVRASPIYQDDGAAAVLWSVEYDRRRRCVGRDCVHRTWFSASVSS